MKRALLVAIVLFVSLACGEKAHSDAELMRMARSQSAWDREVAAYQMIERYKPEFGDSLDLMMIDGDASVRRAVLRNIAKTKDRRFLQSLKIVKGSGVDSEDRLLAAEQYKKIEEALE